MKQKAYTVMPYDLGITAVNESNKSISCVSSTYESFINHSPKWLLEVLSHDERYYHYCDYNHERKKYKVYNSLGQELEFDFYIQGITEELNKRNKKHFTYNWNSWSKCRHYRQHRRIRTFQERKHYVNEYSEYGLKLRARRSSANLPEPWDDINRQETRSWKKHRKNQYKE